MTIQPHTSVLMILGNNTYPFDRRVRHEAETLASAGHRVTVLCPRGPREKRREVVEGVTVQRFPAPPEGQGVFGYIVEFIYSAIIITIYTLYLLMTRPFNVVHVHNPPDTVFVIGFVAKLFGKKFIFDHNDLGPELYQSKFGVKDNLIYRGLVWMERLCCRIADLVVATNESYRQVEIDRHGVAPEKIVIVRNGPRLHEFAAVQPDPDIRAKASTVLAYVGHMSAQDGVDYLLRSLHHLRYTLGYEDFFGVLIGPADDMPGLQRLAKDLRIDDKVWFTGRLPFGEQLLSYAKAADIGVEPAPSNPLNDKSTMIKITEYMALGKPIVAYDLPENIFSADKAALYAERNNEADFAVKIAHLIDHPDLRTEMGNYGRQRMSDKLAWQKSAEQLIYAYADLLGTPEGHIKTV